MQRHANESIPASMETLVKHRRTREGRLTREEWLAKALEVLARKGVAGMRIDALSKALGVTKGSFYWHFKNRDELSCGAAIRTQAVTWCLAQ